MISLASEITKKNHVILKRNEIVKIDGKLYKIIGKYGMTPDLRRVYERKN